MFRVVLYSNMRNVPKTFAKRHGLSFHLNRFNSVYREFSELSDAQNYAFKLLMHVKADICVYLANDKHVVLCIYQEGW